MELRNRFGVTSDISVRYPHVSYLSAEVFAPEMIDRCLAPIAFATRPLALNTGGLLLFSTRVPVIAIPVARTAELSRLHHEIWNACGAAATSPSSPFAPATWLPHITLAQDGLDRDNLGEVVTWLATLDLRWSVPIDNIAVIDSEGSKRVFDFRQSSPAGDVPVRA